MKSFITILFVFLFTFGFSGQAFAHATPISYGPQSADLVQKIPERVAIHFSERIEEKASSISVYGPNGNRVDSGEAKVDSLNSRLYTVEIQDGGEGTYTVSWQVVSSDDGHFTKGAFAFSVGKITGDSSSLGQIQIQHITTTPQAITIGVELVGQAIMLGFIFFLIFLWRPLKKKFYNDISPYINKIESRFTFLFLGGAILIIIGALSFVVLKTFDLQQLRPGDFTVTLKVFLSTVDGSHAFGRAMLALFSIPLFVVFRKSIFKNEKITKVEIGLIFFILLILISRGRVSHAAASHFLPIFSILVNSIQLLFKELWVGGLMVFSVVIPFLFNLKNKIPLASFLTKFSKIISIAFLGVAVTGTYIVWLHLKDPNYLFSTEWGARLITLTLFGVVLFIIRLYHQLVVDKCIVEICQTEVDKKHHRVVSYSMFTLTLEMLVGVALLFVTSLIIITTPPYASERFAFNETTVSQDARVSMSVYKNEPSQFLIDITDTKQKEISVSNLVVTISNAEKSIGPIVVNTEQRFIGGYVFPKTLLSPPGIWRVDISAERPLKYDAVASFTVDYPKDIDISRISTDQQTFGWFEIICLLGALMFVGLAFKLYHFSKKLNDSVLIFIQTRNITEEMRKVPSSLISLSGSFLSFILVCVIVSYSYGVFFKTDFQKVCQKNGHFWLQSIPVKDGKALSSDTVTGCFLDVGLYHFADQREYEFFFRKREIIPELSYQPQKLVAGQPTNIVLSLSEVKDGQKVGPATELGIYHDRILHILIVGEDLKTFAHIHTEDLGPVTEEMKREASFPFQHTFPKAGRYVMNIGYVVSGIEYTNVVIVNVEEGSKMQQPNYSISTNSGNVTQQKEFEGYQITFNAPEKIKAGEQVSLEYYIEKEGKPVRNLEPYLGAAMHLGMVRNDLGRFFHTHGESSQPGSVWFQQKLGKYFKYHMHFAPDFFGPRVITPIRATKFTTPGAYTIFGEFKVEGKVIVTDFEVKVQ